MRANLSRGRRKYCSVPRRSGTGAGWLHAGAISDLDKFGIRLLLCVRVCVRVRHMRVRTIKLPGTCGTRSPTSGAHAGEKN